VKSTVFLGALLVVSGALLVVSVILHTASALGSGSGDEVVEAQLKAQGSDTTKPTDVVFYLYIPRLRDARTAARLLTEDGYTVAVNDPLGRLPDGSYEWRYSVIAHVQEAPTSENISNARRLYAGLARRFNGEYDGWEAAVAP
jgi:rhodanese-related sulfurtransferase